MNFAGPTIDRPCCACGKATPTETSLQPASWAGPRQRSGAASPPNAAGWTWLDVSLPLPDDEAIAAALGSPRKAGTTISTLESHRDQVGAWVEHGVSGTEKVVGAHLAQVQISQELNPIERESERSRHRHSPRAATVHAVCRRFCRANCVEQARVLEGYAGVQLVGIDETSLRRDQDYITVAHELKAKRLWFATPGRSHQTALDFAADLKAIPFKVFRT